MIEGFFRLKDRQTDVKTELIAGLTTFLTMGYVIFVNAQILGDAGMNKAAVVAITCIVSAVSTMAVGFFANAPIAMAPGMGLNAFFTYSLVLGQGLDWRCALGVVFISGFVFFLLGMLRVRRLFVEAIPKPLVSAISVGIGLFITFIGLQKLGVVVDSPATLVQAGAINSKVLIGVMGLLLMIFLEARQIKGSLLAGIVFSTILAVAFGYVTLPEKMFTLHPDVSDVMFKLNLSQALKFSLIGPIFTMMFTDMFDSIGTLVGVATEAGMVDKKGNIKNLNRLLTIDALATMFGAVMGTSTTTAYVESAAGAEQGGRTGLTSIFTGLFFLIALSFVPLVQIVPEYATAPSLIIVGLFMMKNVTKIDFSDIGYAMPSFFIIVMIALSFSISTGLAVGFISYALIQILTGKLAGIKPMMWVITALSVMFFCV